MSISSITTFGSAAIASPPANTTSSAKPNDGPVDAAPALQIIEAAKEVGTGLFVDKKV